MRDRYGTWHQNWRVGEAHGTRGEAQGTHTPSLLACPVSRACFVLGCWLQPLGAAGLHRGLHMQRGEGERPSGDKPCSSPPTCCCRAAYQNYSKALRDAGRETLTDLEGGGFALWDQKSFKYTLNLDGIGCSTRFQKVLATGQVRRARRPPPVLLLLLLLLLLLPAALRPPPALLPPPPPAGRRRRRLCLLPVLAQGARRVRHGRGPPAAGGNCACVPFVDAAQRVLPADLACASLPAAQTVIKQDSELRGAPPRRAGVGRAGGGRAGAHNASKAALLPPPALGTRAPLTPTQQSRKGVF